MPIQCRLGGLSGPGRACGCGGERFPDRLASPEVTPESTSLQMIYGISPPLPLVVWTTPVVPKVRCCRSAVADLTVCPVSPASKHMDGSPFACMGGIVRGPMDAGKFFAACFKGMPLQCDGLRNGDQSQLGAAIIYAGSTACVCAVSCTSQTARRSIRLSALRASLYGPWSVGNQVAPRPAPPPL